jgi:seryl-tRNA synthetase
MLDVQFIRDNKELVKKSAASKRIEIDIEGLLAIDEKRRGMLLELEQLRQQRNQLASRGNQGGGPPSPEAIAQGKEIKQQIADKEKQLEPIENDFWQQLAEVPNVIPEDTPEGGEEANKPEKHWGEPRQDDVVDHQTWGEQRGLIDFERGAKIAGNKFYFLKGALVKLDLAVLEFALDMA